MVRPFFAQMLLLTIPGLQMPWGSSFVAVQQGEQDGWFSVAMVAEMLTASQDRGETLVIDSSWRHHSWEMVGQLLELK